jgi:hypothetical protein
MPQPDKRHKFTREETLRGVLASANIRSPKKAFHYAKALERVKQEGRWIDILKSILASPVASGTLVYLIVITLEKAQQSTSAPKTKISSGNIATSLGQEIQSVFGGVLTGGASASAISEALTGPFGGLLQIVVSSTSFDLTALKAAIILYIASGGNLPGILQSSSSAITSIMSTLGAAAPAAVAAVG